jgi:hypothetical protein
LGLSLECGREAAMAAKRYVVLGIACLAGLTFSASVGANPNAACTGQFSMSVAPQSAGFVGENVSFEAQNPEVVGATAFGRFISTVATAPHDECPF